ncbi:hypothetical protein CVT26_002449 [Gymnopilus dilepis]|uniref:Uncharacterized protein n=1 Tax=Gymnopilus dilepis TaxID=231916 RepID=A0A409YWY9_9AGAR|nr:hypothetical protein CVT26_002449 [Gymnopilus dilepis]
MSPPLESASDNPISAAQQDLIQKRLQLPDVLKPPPKSQPRLFFRHGIFAVAEVLPLDTIPSGLRTFRVGRHLQPPMFDFGWPVNPEELVTLAETKGFLGAKTFDRNAHPLARINIYDSQHLLQHVVRDDLGITTIVPQIKFIFTKIEEREGIVCLSTTWNDAWDDPPQEDVAKITAYLGLEHRPPKWYNDYEEGKWAFRTFRTFPVPREVVKYATIHYEGINTGGCKRCIVRPL